MAKLESKLTKMNGWHLALAARVTVANGLILSSLWYVITLRAGDTIFFQQDSEQTRSLCLGRETLGGSKYNLTKQIKGWTWPSLGHRPIQNYCRQLIGLVAGSWLTPAATNSSIPHSGSITEEMRRF